jgi:predicted 3-demethylubiquinone-9 3-methyltransferase (glyoxalase superfamily)
MAADWTMNGMGFRGINGGPEHARFTEAISLSVSCADQGEVDYYWDNLVAGGRPDQCGWLKDRFGLSWQIVPDRLVELLSDPDPARAEAAMRAMLGMQKIVIADMEAAADAAQG